MQLLGKLHAMEQFGKDNQYNKAVFLDYDDFDKVALMVEDDDVKALSALVGKDIQVTVAAEKKGYDYSLKMKTFKARVAA